VNIRRPYKIGVRGYTELPRRVPGRLALVDVTRFGRPKSR
jgi:hypothetical protein